jgi:hypothetical protein
MSNQDQSRPFPFFLLLFVVVLYGIDTWKGYRRAEQLKQRLHELELKEDKEKNATETRKREAFRADFMQKFPLHRQTRGKHDAFFTVDFSRAKVEVKSLHEELARTAANYWSSGTVEIRVNGVVSINGIKYDYTATVEWQETQPPSITRGRDNRVVSQSLGHSGRFSVKYLLLKAL